CPGLSFLVLGKKRSPDGFFPLLRIGHKSFDLRGSCSEDFNPQSPGMLPNTFSGGIGREASSLEGELWCDPKRSKRWPMLPTSGERSSGVINHWKCTCSEGNGLS
uniref:Uncharacterized protein n=1 Tax=Cucumis melo TaxID=3656 RepID=A0A9I9E229_CUCME